MAFPKEQLDALQSFYDATGGEHWRWHNKDPFYRGIPWNFSNPNANPCIDHWEGVYCQCNYILTIDLPIEDSHGEIFIATELINTPTPLIIGNCSAPQVGYSSTTSITSLSLVDMNVNGTLPVESISRLSFLMILDLRGNKLHGTIPSLFYTNLTNLQVIQLGYNHLEGTVSSSIGNMTALQGIDISYNHITGTLDGFFTHSLPKLTHLSFGGNHLTGSLSSNLCQFTELQYIHLPFNNLTSSLPDCMYTSLTKLIQLEIGGNRFTGTISSQIAHLQRLEVLYLASNFFEGELPITMNQLSDLLVLLISVNRFSGSLIGRFDKAIGSSSSSSSSVATPSDTMIIFDISSNLFSGPLVNETYSTFQWPHLQRYLAFANQISGTIPETLMENSPYLYIVDLGTNMLTGSIPQSLSNCQYMLNFLAFENHLTGRLDHIHWDKFKNLTGLVLFNNSLTGSLPDSFGTLHSLAFLGLFNNELTGSIPKEVSKWTKITEILISGNRFTGNINNLFSPNANSLVLVDAASNFFTGTIPGETLKEYKVMTSLCLSNNCLHGTIPEAICELKQLDALALDGINTASQCRHMLFGNQLSNSLSLNAFLVKERVGGTIPTCLFEMPSLSLLRLSGLELTGKLPSTVNISDSLHDLSLSHNLLTGSIPSNFLARVWTYFDLSYNKLNGDLYALNEMDIHNTRIFNITRLVLNPKSVIKFFDPTIDTASNEYPFLQNTSVIEDLPTSRVVNQLVVVYRNITLNLRVNRITGTIPDTVTALTDLHILEGNTFSCNQFHPDLPSHDPDSHRYVCGSTQMTDALSSWGVAALVPVIVLLIGIWKFYRQRKMKQRQQREREKNKENDEKQNGDNRNRDSRLQSRSIERSTTASSSVRPSAMELSVRNSHIGSSRPIASQIASSSTLNSSPNTGMIDDMDSQNESSKTNWEDTCDHYFRLGVIPFLSYVVSTIVNPFPHLNSSESSSSSSSSLYNPNVAAMNSHVSNFHLLVNDIRRACILLSAYILIVMLPIYVILGLFHRTHRYAYLWEYSAVWLSGEVAGIVLTIDFIVFLGLTIFLVNICVIKYHVTRQSQYLYGRSSIVSSSDASSPSSPSSLSSSDRTQSVMVDIKSGETTKPLSTAIATVISNNNSNNNNTSQQRTMSTTADGWYRTSSVNHNRISMLSRTFTMLFRDNDEMIANERDVFDVNRLTIQSQQQQHQREQQEQLRRQQSIRQSTLSKKDSIIPNESGNVPGMEKSKDATVDVVEVIPINDELPPSETMSSVLWRETKSRAFDGAQWSGFYLIDFLIVISVDMLYVGVYVDYSSTLVLLTQIGVSAFKLLWTDFIVVRLLLFYKEMVMNQALAYYNISYIPGEHVEERTTSITREGSELQQQRQEDSMSMMPLSSSPSLMLPSQSFLQSQQQLPPLSMYYRESQVPIPTQGTSQQQQQQPSFMKRQHVDYLVDNLDSIRQTVSVIDNVAYRITVAPSFGVPMNAYGTTKTVDTTGGASISNANGVGRESDKRQSLQSQVEEQSMVSENLDTSDIDKKEKDDGRYTISISSLPHRDIMKLCHIGMKNKIIFPCFAVFLISNSCFYTAIIPVNPVSASALYCFQLSYVGVPCINILASERDGSSYSPPFLYSFQCASAFIRYYAPVFVYMTAVSSIALPCLFWCLRYCYQTYYLNEVEEYQEYHDAFCAPEDEDVDGDGGDGEKERDTVDHKKDSLFAFSFVGGRRTSTQRKSSLFNTSSSSNHSRTVEKLRYKSYSGGKEENRNGNGNGKEETGKKKEKVIRKRSFLLKLILFILPLDWYAHTLEQFHILIQRGNSKQQLVVKTLSSFAVLISFGALFPFLALILCVAIYVNTIIEQMNTQALLQRSFALQYPVYSIKLTQECKEFCSSFKSNLRYSILLASLFFAYFAFDTLGDTLGWQIALVAPILIYMFQFIIQSSIRLVHSYQRLKGNQQASTMRMTTSSRGSSATENISMSNKESNDQDIVDRYGSKASRSGRGNQNSIIYDHDSDHENDREGNGDEEGEFVGSKKRPTNASSNGIVRNPLYK